MTARLTTPSRRSAIAGATLSYERGRGRPLPEPPRLVVTAGPAKGAEHRLSAHPATVGRGPHNALVLPDLSVSRRHSRLEKRGGRWVLLDQGSGNGTRVNGRRIERQALQHGDEIQLGDTKLRFVEPGGVLVNGAAPVPEAPVGGRFRPGGKALLGMALLLALAAAVAVRERPRSRPQPPAQDAESRAFARKRFQEGVALLEEGKWSAAREKLRIAVELDGHDAQVARYVQAVEDEAPRAAQLETAREALARKDYAAARGALAGIPDDSVLAASAAALGQKLRDAQAHLPPPVKPARRGQLAPLALPSAPPGEVRRILDAYLSGDVAEALRRARKAVGAAAGTLRAGLESFDAASREGLALQQAGRDVEAVRKLEEALAADLRITGGAGSGRGRALRKVLSSLHSRIAASLPEDDEALPVAGAHLARAVADDPENTAAQRLLQKVASRCREIYLRGYVEKEDDPGAARKAFALVSATLPASDETGQKARRWLEKLDGKEPRRE